MILIFTSQFRIYIVRERRYFWSSRPGRELALATIVAIAVFTMLGIYGGIITAITPVERQLKWDRFKAIKTVHSGWVAQAPER
jgi:hypothetical protein